MAEESNKTAVEMKVESFTILNHLYDGMDGLTDPDKILETAFYNLFDLMEEDKDFKIGVLYSAELLLRAHGYKVMRPN
jgi:hypothetical protein